ncbi:adenosylcobinamide amidohydrolase [Magnetospirillum fulvum]|uniref:Adenosylcobinamide hydrolase n=1 Tax=Magnetospirillum fulvum TaxID=1082 RepID=A0A1H6INS5_MAGFU|nr:adenosylcobinamide amidohydrolase [Magnetospirillum fulvum]SEH51350.1 adenosylcobinamide hydrolase [Magnetospirillum fulvum]
MTRLLDIDLRPPWLIARLPGPFRIAGWSLNRPGLTNANSVAWLEVCDADLPLGLDPLDLLNRRLAEQGLDNAAGLMTARDVRRFCRAVSDDETVRVESLVTLGLTNGSILDGRGWPSGPVGAFPVGTINLLVVLSVPLGDGALLEALALAATARTAALLAEGGRIVGTGTDCILVACPPAPTGESFAGLHTPVGCHLTAAVFQATFAARREWEAENAPLLDRIGMT